MQRRIVLTCFCANASHSRRILSVYLNIDRIFVDLARGVVNVAPSIQHHITSGNQINVENVNTMLTSIMVTLFIIFVILCALKIRVLQFFLLVFV